MLHIGVLMAGIIIFANIGLIHDYEYYRKLAENVVPLPRVSFHLPIEVLPGWLLQTRELWYMPSLSTGGFKQVVLGAFIPLLLLGFVVFGVRRHRPALALVALAGVYGMVAVYAYTSREECTYCAERDLLPLAPIAAVLLALGLATLLAMPRRGMRMLGVAAAALVVLAVAQRTRVELTRFADSSYFLDSANRSVLADLPRNASAVQLEGFGQTLSARAEQPLVYYLADERLRGKVSILLGSNLNGAISYLDFGIVKSPGAEFHPTYDYVLTRFASIETDRQLIARSGPIALERRTSQLDITSYSGLEAGLARLETSGIAWVQPGIPLQFYIVGTKGSRVWAKLSFSSSGPVSIAPQAGIRQQQNGKTLVVCAPATGAPPTRSVSLQLTAPAIAGPVPSEEFSPPVPLEGIALTAMHAVVGSCAV